MAADRADLVARKELRIFRQFAEVCPLRIENDAIEKREPDEPDILCRTPAGSVAFEMVEIVDREKVARPRGDQDALMDVMHEAARNLPQEIKDAFANAWIGVRFRNDRSLRRRRQVAERVVNELVELDRAFSGDYPITEGEVEVARAEVQRRDGLAGPFFRYQVVGHFNPIPSDALLAKFNKRYVTAHPIELLAYFDKQEAPPRQQIDELIGFIEANIGDSQFGRVWLFNCSRFAHLLPNRSGIVCW